MRITPQLISLAVVIFSVAVLIIVIGVFGKSGTTTTVTDYDTCIAAGGTTYDGYDGVCTHDEQTYYSDSYYSGTSTDDSAAY